MFVADYEVDSLCVFRSRIAVALISVMANWDEPGPRSLLLQLLPQQLAQFHMRA